MNCGEFQNCLAEFVEGTLSSSGKATADEHLARCGDCREAFEREQRLAQFLSHEFAQSTESLKLSADVRQRITSKLSQETSVHARAPGNVFAGLRLAWPVAIAASVLVGAVLLGGFFLREPKPDAGQPHGELRPSAASVRFSYVVPVYTFRRDGDLVIDTLTWTTNVVDQTLWVKN